MREHRAPGAADRAPRRVSVRSRAWCAAPDHLAVTRPRGGPALDGACPASALLARGRPPGGGTPGAAFATSPSRRLFRPRARSCEGASGDPCRAPRPPGRSRASFGAPAPPPPRPRQGVRRRTARSAFGRQVLLEARSRGPRGTRHRSRRLAAGDPASGAASPRPSFRSVGLDPSWGSASSSPAGREGHAPPVDFCRRVRSRSNDHRNVQTLRLSSGTSP